MSNLNRCPKRRVKTGKKERTVWAALCSEARTFVTDFRLIHDYVAAKMTAPRFQDIAEAPSACSI